MLKIVYTQKAKTDLKEIEAYIAKDNLFFAGKVIESVLSFINGMLPFFSKSGKKHRNQKTREIIEPTFKYRIIYKIHKNEIAIYWVSKRKNE